jgi:hypothetical protein
MQFLIKRYKYPLFLLSFFVAFECSAVIETKEQCAETVKKAIENIKNKNYTEGLDMLFEAKFVAANNNWDKELFLAYNGIGVIYSEILNYGDALENFLEAYKIALKSLDTYSEKNALINIAIMYFKSGNSDKAIEYLLKVYNDAKLANNTVIMGISATNLGIIYNKEREIEKAKKFLEIAERYLQQDEHALPHVKVAEIENVFLAGDFSAAKRLAKEIIPTVQEPKDKEHLMNVYLILSNIYESEYNSEQAIHYASMAAEICPNINSRVEVFEQLSQIYFLSNEYKTAFAYKDSIVFAKDSLNRLTNLVNFENNRVKFEMATYQKDLENSKTRLKRERILFILLVALCFILIWAIYTQTIKERQKKIIAEKNQKVISLELEQMQNNKLILEQQLKAQETLALLKQERFLKEQEILKNKIDSKNRELAVKAMHLSSKNELIDDIYSSLKQESYKDNNILKLLDKLRSQVKTESEGNDFLRYFEEVNHDFIQKLKERFPDLTASDIRFLSYIYIGLNTKEIAFLLNITPDSCKKKKMRIGQKLEIEGGAAELYGFLSSI